MLDLPVEQYNVMYSLCHQTFDDDREETCFGTMDVNP
jgi:hypothetical protein